MRILKFFLITIIICVNTQVYAEHLLGGQMDIVSINQKSSTEYEIGFELELITDEDLVPAENEVQIGLFVKDDNQWKLVQEYSIPLTDKTLQSSPIDNVCSSIGDRVVNLYSSELELFIENKEYMFAFLRCCKTPTVINMYNPEENGTAIMLRFFGETLVDGFLSPRLTNMDDYVLKLNSSNTLELIINTESAEVGFSNTLQVGGVDGSGGPSTGDAFSCTGIVPLPQNCPPPYDNIEVQNGFSLENQFVYSDDVTLIDNVLDIHPTLPGNYVISFEIVLYDKGKLMYVKTYENIFEVTDCTINNVLDDLKSSISLQSNLVDNVLEIVSQGQELEFVIYGQAGNLVKKGTSHGDIKVNELQNGLYFLQLNNAGELTSLKFIKHNR